MANATATQAYTAVRAIEATMTTAKGYNVVVQTSVAVAKIIEDNAGVDTEAEALVGIRLAVGAADAAAATAGEYNALELVGYQATDPATDKLYIDETRQIVTSLTSGS